jgi:sodium/hydrogen antiporter
LCVSLAAVGGLLLLLGMLGGVLKERRPVSEPFIALFAGVLIGPAILGLLDLAELGNEMVILEEVTLVTPGVALVGVALRLPVVVLTTILPTLVAQRWFAPDHQEEAAADR